MAAVIKLHGIPLTATDRAKLNNGNASHVWLDPVQTASLEPLTYEVIVPMFEGVAGDSDIMAHQNINGKPETRMAFEDRRSAIQMYEALKDLGLNPQKTW